MPDSDQRSIVSDQNSPGVGTSQIGRNAKIFWPDRHALEPKRKGFRPTMRGTDEGQFASQKGATDAIDER